MSNTMKINISTRSTPLNDLYPTCDRTFAELRIYPKTLNTSQITEILDLSPSDLGNAREIQHNSYGKMRTVKNTHWLLSSEKFVQSKDLRIHLNWFINILFEKSDGLINISNMDDCKMSIDCTWWSAVGHGGPTLWPEQLRALAEIGLEVSFDIQFYEPA